MMTKTNAPRQTKSKILILLPMTAILIAGMSLINAPAQENQPAKQATQVKVLPTKTPLASSTNPVIAKADPQKPQPSVKFDKPDVEENFEIPQEPPVAAVSLIRMNVLYLGVDNPVKIAVSNYSPSEVRVEIDNGFVGMENNEYVIRPKTVGKAILTIYANNKIISKEEYRVKIVPDPVAKVFGRKGGTIDKGILEAKARGKQLNDPDRPPFIYADMENFDFNLQFTVTGFTMTTTQNGQVVSEKSPSNKATEAQISMINKSETGQKIYFENIEAVGPDGGLRKLPPMAFEIK